jgi:hypothetical protein
LNPTQVQSWAKVSTPVALEGMRIITPRCWHFKDGDESFDLLRWGPPPPTGITLCK